MLLRNSISSTKKFFQKTIQNFKSFFSASEHYEKLPKGSPYDPFSFTIPAGVDKRPKTSPYDPFSFTIPAGVDVNPQTSNYQDHEKFYSDFTDRWDSDNGKAKKRDKKKMMMSTDPTGEQKEGNNGSFTQFTTQKREANDQSKTRIGRVEKRQEDQSKTRTARLEKRQEYYSYSKSKREARSLSVAQKLKELEMMDITNVDHVLDVEEVLHYYSRLTCPAYLDIVDKFFMDMYTEFLGPPASPGSVNSRAKFQSVRA